MRRQKGAHTRRRKLRRSWPQRAVIVLGGLSAVVLACSAAGLGYLYRKVERIPRIELSRALDEVDDAGGPQNYLVVGIDSAARIDPDDPIRNGRDNTNLTDTIMIMRVDPSSQQASILSIPRDTWVAYPTGGHGKINGLYSQAGGTPDLLIQVINEYLGIPIHHYVQIDLAGFYDLVDAIDGVPVYFPRPARDTHSGLWITQSGCVTLDREQAIGYVRSRHYEELAEATGNSNRDWEPDNKNDFGRIERQQDFIRRALERAVDKGARNPGTLDRLIDVGLGSVTIDDELTPGGIFDLARAFRSFDPNSLQNNTLPTVGDTGPGGASIQRLVEVEAEAVLAPFRGTPPPAEAAEPGTTRGADEGAVVIAPESVRLTVLNGTGQPGQAGEAGDALAAAGFNVIARADATAADLGQEHTVIRFPAGSRPQAELVARWLEADAELVEVPVEEGSADDAGVGIEVITGADFDGVRSEAAPPSATEADTTTTTSTTTSSTLPEEGSTTDSDVPTPGDTTTTTTTPPSC